MQKKVEMEFFLVKDKKMPPDSKNINQSKFKLKKSKSSSNYR